MENIGSPTGLCLLTSQRGALPPKPMSAGTPNIDLKQGRDEPTTSAQLSGQNCGNILGQESPTNPRCARGGGRARKPTHEVISTNAARRLEYTSGQAALGCNNTKRQKDSHRQLWPAASRTAA